MSKKLTYEFVKEQFEKAGHIPKFTEYINNKSKLDYVCPNGHAQAITWSNFNKGHGCSHCAGNIQHDTEFVKSEFIKENYTPEFDEYINNKQKLDYICDKGHKHFSSWTKWQQGCRCPYCYGNAKHSTEFIKNEFIKENYIPEFDEYINAYTALDYTCPNKHKHSMTWHNWQKGARCPSCYGNVKLTYEFVKEQFSKVGKKLLETEYINSSTKMKYRCFNGQIHSISWDNLKDVKECNKCARNAV